MWMWSQLGSEDLKHSFKHPPLLYFPSDYDRKVLISSKRLCLSKENVGISFSLELCATIAHSKTDLSLIGESGE